MTISPAQRDARGQTPGEHITIALAPAARSQLWRLQERTGLPTTHLANCAITWYAYFDAQLRAGHDLIVWNGRAGKGHILSLAAGTPAVARDVRWAPGISRARGAGSGNQAAAPGLNPGTARRPPAPASWRSWPGGPADMPAMTASPALGLSRPGPPGPVTAAARARLTVATSRGSPGGGPGRGAAPLVYRPATGLQDQMPLAAAGTGRPS